MAKRGSSSSASVLAAFLGLSNDKQWEFVVDARNRGRNAIAELCDKLWAEIGSVSMDEMIADDNYRMTEMELRRMKRKPNRAAGMEVVRLHDEEELSFGQIAKRLGLNSETTARQRYNREIKRQQQEGRRER